MVLIVVDRLVEFAAQNLLDDGFAHFDKSLNPLAGDRSKGAVK